MLIGILLTCLIIYSYQKYYNHSSVDVLREKNSSNKTNLFQTTNDLPNFKALKPYRTLFVHRGQAQFILTGLIIEATRTKIFTIVSKHTLLNDNYMFLQIELVQETQTIIALIEYCPPVDENLNYFFTLRQFFGIVFEPSKTIQTWGSIIEHLRPYTNYGLFSLNEVIQTQTINIQKDFKLWYNRTFRHRTLCQRYLKYDDIDGPLCSCAHRPYKSPSNQWSIARALAYTFEEYFSYHLHDMHRCLAITKLAHAVNQKWTIQHLNNYKQKHHINQYNL